MWPSVVTADNFQYEDSKVVQTIFDANSKGKMNKLLNDIKTFMILNIYFLFELNAYFETKKKWSYLRKMYIIYVSCHISEEWSNVAQDCMFCVVIDWYWTYICDVEWQTLFYLFI